MNKEDLQFMEADLLKAVNQKLEMRKLKELCIPIVEFIKTNHDPHTTIIITSTQVKVVKDEMGIVINE